MKVPLEVWHRRWQWAQLDTTTGKIQVQWLRRRPVTRGWAARICRRWFALWCDDTDLVFHIGSDAWAVTPTLKCTNVIRGDTRTIVIARGADTLWEFQYEAHESSKDPALDSIDLETDDFLYWVALVWNDRELRNDLIASLRTRVGGAVKEQSS